MKKIMIFILLLFSLGAMSQVAKIKQNILKSDGKYKVQYNKSYFDVDTVTITVKFKDAEKLSREYNVLRKNKLGYADLVKPPGIPVEEYAEHLSEDENVESIIYSTYGEFFDFIPNDPLLSNQWYLSAINAYGAWDITTGDPSIIVGILDSELRWSHPDLGLGNDLYQNIYLSPGEDAWTNPNDPTTGNGIDDDNNGFIDDWKGWNFGNNSNDVRDTNSDFFHGIFIAGIIGAKTNNNEGIAGIAGGKNNEGVKILFYRIGDGYSLVSSVVDDAIVAAVDNGAKIIQLSFGFSYETEDINDAIQYAKEHNVVIVCAIGNDGPAYPIAFPASHPYVIGVGATNQSNQRAYFSRVGDQLDIVAPGLDIFSTNIFNGYGRFSGHGNGTSFSAPQVSGAAALLLSVDSTLTPAQIRGILGNTAQRVGGYSYQTTEGHPHGTWNQEMGYGLLDAYAAVQEALCAPIDIINETTLTDIEFKGCIVNLEGVTVQSGTKLTVGAYKETNITGPFEVENGAEFEAGPSVY